MHRLSAKLSARWSRLVVNHWHWVLLFWLAAVIISRVVAPSWQQVAYDGDFEHLPPYVASSAGTRLLDEAFPTERPRSQFMVVFSRDEAPLGRRDQHVALDLSRRLRHRLGVVYFRRAIASGWSGTTAPVNAHVRELIEDAEKAFDRAIDVDEEFFEYFQNVIPQGIDPLYEPRLAIAYWDRARLRDSIGRHDDAAKDREIASALNSKIGAVPAIEDRDEPLDAMLDILSWNDKMIGGRLSKRNLRLVVIRLESEFLATGNIRLLRAMDQLIEDVRRFALPLTKPGLKIEIAGSAAIGGETLTAAKASIQYTEWFTVLLIIVILAMVYRAPALVAVPLVSIGVSVVCATGLVSELASIGLKPGMEWVDLKIFTTSRIFVVVILFGAGTDYCLFLIARLREEAAHRPWNLAVEHALAKVMGALLGSALTTVVGLWMMWVADFGKFHYVGPIIGICLLVGLAVCTTLTPALLYILGPRVFWPSGPQHAQRHTGFWKFVALAVTFRPRATLFAGIGLLLGPALYGYYNQSDVSYDITAQLSEDSRSRQGVRTLSRSYSLGESNPITLLLVHRQQSDPEQSRQTVRDLVAALYKVDGVKGVRYLDDPFGDNPPGQRRSVLAIDSLLSWTLKQHRATRRYFTSSEASYKDRLIRLDVIIDDEPFGASAANTLDRIIDHVDTMMDQFMIRLSLPPETPIADLDQARDRLWKAVERMKAIRLENLPPSAGIESIQSLIGGTGLAWFDDGKAAEEDRTAKVLVKITDERAFVPLAKRLVETIRNGDQQLRIDPIPNAKINIIPSPIIDCEMEVTGTVMALNDLKSVTTRDTIRIKCFVVAAVFVILLIVIRRVPLSVYLIFTVLLSYFATLGISIALFRFAYGDAYVGLDWKLPLFLFVILVAVGQDYNVYLVTRVLEEQRRGGRLAGLRRAIVRTGGIITSCGVVMAGTFFTMTAPAWAPQLFELLGIKGAPDQSTIMLRGVVELGFALGLGVLLDTFYVRTILVPAYMAAFDQRKR